MGEPHVQVAPIGYSHGIGSQSFVLDGSGVGMIREIDGSLLPREVWGAKASNLSKLVE